MDNQSLVPALVTLRRQFEEASSRWPEIHNQITVSLNTDQASLALKSSSTRTTRNLIASSISALTGQKYRFSTNQTGETQELVLPAINMDCRFTSVASIAEGIRAMKRFEDLAAAAWRSTLQLPPSAWQLLSPPSDASLDTLVGRMWLAPYRAFYDAENFAAQLKRLADRGTPMDTCGVDMQTESCYVMKDLPGQDPTWLWLLVVYNIGWQSLTTSALALRRYAWDDLMNLVFRRSDSELVLNDAYGALPASTSCPIPVEWFRSEMSDPFLQSALAIDMLVRAADGELRPPNAAEAMASRHRAKRGRRPKFSAEADQKLRADYKATGLSMKDFAASRQMTYCQLRRAFGRIRKRRKGKADRRRAK